MANRRIISLGGGGSASFPLLAPNGAVGTPSYAFSADSTTGMYRNGASQLTFAVGGRITVNVVNTGASARIDHYWSDGVIQIRLGNTKGFVSVPSVGALAWTSSATDASIAADTGVSRAAAAVVAIGNGTAGDFSGTVKTGNAITTAAAPTVAASQIGLGSTTATTVGAAGGASALPATPLGYMIINVAGTAAKIPYYNN